MSSRLRAWTALLAGVSLTVSCTELLNLDIEFVGDGGGGEGGAGPTGEGGVGPGGGAPSTTITASSTSGSSTSGSSTSTGEGGTGGCDATLAEASDDFNDGDGDGWCQLVPLPPDDPEASITFPNAGARLRAGTGFSAWDSSGEYGAFLYRRIAADEGDFVVATKLSVSNGSSGEPVHHAHGGGLLIRRPNPNPGDFETDLLWTRTYDTNNSPAGMAAVAWRQEAGGGTVEQFAVGGGGSVALAICKHGSTYQFFHHEGVDWSEPLTLPDDAMFDDDPVLEVGVTVHTYKGGDIVEADFDGVFFASAQGACETELPDLDRIR